MPQSSLNFHDSQHVGRIDDFAPAFANASAGDILAVVLLALVAGALAMFVLRWIKPRIPETRRRLRSICICVLPALCGLFVASIARRTAGVTGLDPLLLHVMALASVLLLFVQIPALLLELIFRPVPALRVALRCLSWLAWLCVMFVAVQSDRDLDSVLEAAHAIRFSAGAVDVDLLSIAAGAATAIIAVIVAHGTQNWLGRRLGESKRLAPNLALAIRRIVDIAVWTIAIAMVLTQAGVDLKAMAAFAGALGIGIGLGLQRLAASYISGLIVLFEQSVRIGDTIAAGGVKGRVTHMTVRYTTIMTGDGIEALVPNETLTANTVTNQSWTDNMLRLANSIHIDVNTDAAVARQAILQILDGQARVLRSPAPAVYVADISDGRIRLEAQYWIADPANGQLNLTSDINEAILRAFRYANIRMARPLAVREVARA